MSDAYGNQSRTGKQTIGTTATTPKAGDITTPKAGDITEQARALGRDVKKQASELADSTSEAVKAKASELADSAKEMASDAGEKLKASVQDQKAAGADYMGNVANIVRRAANEFQGEIPQAAHYIRKAATQIEGVSQALRNRDLSELVASAQDFARRQPTAFFGAAVLAGFVAIRFLKSSSPQNQGSENQGSSQRPSSLGTMAQNGSFRPSGSASSYPGGMASGR